MAAPSPWQRVRSHPVFTNHWLTVRQDTVTLPNGACIDDYFLVELPPVALIMPMTSWGEVVFVRQYRHAAAQVMLELPAGNFDPRKESAASAAMRELQEETGYQAVQVEPLGILFDNPVKCTYETHVFLAQNVVPIGGQAWDVTEEIEVVLLSLNDVSQAITDGQIAVSGSIAALHLGIQHLRASSMPQINS
ncbi:MAG: NUDIX hydrolase [Leptolyngbya sp. SIO1D8]|nr:NUDIX hydrolase [Leptolyngbya sp. SIO1D8]